MSAEEYGAVIEVSTTNAGTVFAADAAVSATVITLADVTPFEELGGQVYIDGQTYYYESVDQAASTMTLLVGLVSDAFVDETRVEIYPPAPLRTAMVAFGVEEGEAVRVTIPHFFAGMPDGIRPADARETALVEERNPGELYLKDVMSKGMTLLGLGEDLDNYTSQGVFIQLFSADAATGTNYPVPYAGVLEVLSTSPADVIIQRYTAYRTADDIHHPSPWVRSFGAGSWSTWNEVAAGVLPGGSYILTTAGGQSITHNTPTAVALNLQRELVGMTWDGTNKRFVIDRAGRYQINAAVMFKAAGTTGRMQCVVHINGVQQLNSSLPFPSVAEFASAQGSFAYRLAVDDTVAMLAIQTTGVSRSLHEDEGCWLDVSWLSP